MRYCNIRKAKAKDESRTEGISWRQEHLDTKDTGQQYIEYIISELEKSWTNLYSIQQRVEYLRKSYLEDIVAHKIETRRTTDLKNLSI